MKRHQKTFSVEIKKSRTQGQRQHLLPRQLFATLPNEAPPLIQKAESRAVAEAVMAPRILPSIVAVVPTGSETAMPTRHRQVLISKADREQIEFDLCADPTGEGTKEGPDQAPTPDGSKAGSAPVAEERTAAEDEVRRQDVQRSETKARKHRTKASEFVDPVETSPPVAASLLIQADLMASAAGVELSQKACRGGSRSVRRLLFNSRATSAGNDVSTRRPGKVTGIQGRIDAAAAPRRGRCSLLTLMQLLPSAFAAFKIDLHAAELSSSFPEARPL